MSHLQYYNETGIGERHSDLYHYSQAVVLDNVIKISGQGGWTNEGSLDPNDEVGQVKLAFENIERVLKAAGGKGLDDVYSTRSYHINVDASAPAMVDELKRHFTIHKPIWTAVGVPRLVIPEMLIEIEVEARI